MNRTRTGPRTNLASRHRDFPSRPRQRLPRGTIPVTGRFASCPGPGAVRDPRPRSPCGSPCPAARSPRPGRGPGNRQRPRPCDTKRRQLRRPRPVPPVQPRTHQVTGGSVPAPSGVSEPTPPAKRARSRRGCPVAAGPPSPPSRGTFQLQRHQTRRGGLGAARAPPEAEQRGRAELGGLGGAAQRGGLRGTGGTAEEEIRASPGPARPPPAPQPSRTCSPHQCAPTQPE